MSMIVRSYLHLKSKFWTLTHFKSNAGIWSWPWSNIQIKLMLWLNLLLLLMHIGVLVKIVGWFCCECLSFILIFLCFIQVAFCTVFTVLENVFFHSVPKIESFYCIVCFSKSVVAWIIMWCCNASIYHCWWNDILVEYLIIVFHVFLQDAIFVQEVTFSDGVILMCCKKLLSNFWYLHIFFL